MQGQGKTFKITDFNTTPEREQFYKDLDKTRMAMGREVCPVSGKSHLQIHITFARNYRWKAMQKLLGIGTHFEIASATDWNYELKDMNYHIEDHRRQGKRSDLDKIKELKNLREGADTLSYQALRHAELRMKYTEKGRRFKPEVYWLYGPSGSGKTRFVYDGAEDIEDIFVPISFKWWEGYDAHAITIIDDFRADWCLFHELLKLLDRYPYRVETKGGSRQFLSKKIYITTPYSIAQTFRGNGEDLKQLTRRITKEINFGTETEVKEGNNDFLDDESFSCRY